MQLFMHLSASVLPHGASRCTEGFAKQVQNQEVTSSTGIAVARGLSYNSQSAVRRVVPRLINSANTHRTAASAATCLQPTRLPLHAADQCIAQANTARLACKAWSVRSQVTANLAASMPPNQSLNRTHCGMRLKARHFILGL